MPVGQKHHQAVTVAVAVGLGCFDQLLDLVACEMLAGAQLSIGRAPRRDCSIFSGWRDQSKVGICPGLCAPLDSDCSNNRHFMNSDWMKRAAEAALTASMPGASHASSRLLCLPGMRNQA